MKVALDAARGLAFLHSSETKVIYRDFKTSNILLDSVCELFTFNFLYSVICRNRLDVRSELCMLFDHTELQCKTF